MALGGRVECGQCDFKGPTLSQVELCHRHLDPRRTLRMLLCELLQEREREKTERSGVRIHNPLHAVPRRHSVQWMMYEAPSIEQDDHRVGACRALAVQVSVSCFYLQLLYGLAVLLLSAQLGHLDQDGSGLPRVLGLETRRQLSALVRLLGDRETAQISSEAPGAAGDI